MADAKVPPRGRCGPLAAAVAWLAVSATNQPQGSPGERVTHLPAEERTGARATQATPATGPPRYPNAGDANAAPDRGPARPRWMAVLGTCIAVAVVLLIVLLHLTGVIGDN